MRRFLTGCVFAALALCAVASGVVPSSIVVSSVRAEAFRFIAVGDMPYRLPQDNVRFDALIDRINALNPAFTVHVGDIKSSGTPCSDAAFARVRQHFDRFAGALVYTPGDNEWTDCHVKPSGGFNALERLARLRTMFFPVGKSLGRKPLSLRQQSAAAEFAPFVENAMWRHGGMQFAAIHVVGSANNLQRGREEIEEYLARNAAGLNWLNRAFDRARETSSPGLVLFIHANPLFELGRYRRAGFNDFIDLLTRRTIAFGRPVLLVHGDTHVFQFDQPLGYWDNGKRRQVDHFFRLEVFGDQRMHGVEVTIDAQQPGLFSVRPVIVNSTRTHPPTER